MKRGVRAHRNLVQKVRFLGWPNEMCAYTIELPFHVSFYYNGMYSNTIFITRFCGLNYICTMKYLFVKYSGFVNFDCVRYHFVIFACKDCVGYTILSGRIR
jgi:hypothetical protein